MLCVAVYAPIPCADDCVYQGQAVHVTVMGFAADPWAALVLDFYPHVVAAVDLGADSELAAGRGGVAVHPRVGSQLRSDQDRVVGARATIQQQCERSPNKAGLATLSRIAAYEGPPFDCIDTVCCYQITSRSRSSRVRV